MLGYFLSSVMIKKGQSSLWLRRAVHSRPCSEDRFPSSQRVVEIPTALRTLFVRSRAVSAEVAVFADLVHYSAFRFSTGRIWSTTSAVGVMADSIRSFITLFLSQATCIQTPEGVRLLYPKTIQHLQHRTKLLCPRKTVTGQFD